MISLNVAASPENPDNVFAGEVLDFRKRIFFVHGESDAILADQIFFMLSEGGLFLRLDVPRSHAYHDRPVRDRLLRRPRAAAGHVNQNRHLGKRGVDFVPGLELFHELAGAVRNYGKQHRKQQMRIVPSKVLDSCAPEIEPSARTVNRTIPAMSCFIESS